MPRPSTHSVNAATIAFALLVLFVGGNAVAVKFTVLELDPFWGAASRFLVAGAIFAAWMALRGHHLAQGRGLLGDLLYCLTTYVIPFGLVYTAAPHVHASLLGTVFALGPLLTMLLASAHGIERITARAIGGAILALAGTVVIFADQLELEVPLWALLFLLGGVTSLGESIVLVKYFPTTDPVAKNALGMLLGGAVLLACSFAAGDTMTVPQERNTWLAVVYLVLLGSVATFTLYLFVLKSWSASTASYEFVLAPLVTIALGAWWLDERVSAWFGVGVALILAGVYLGVIRAAPEAMPRPSPTSTLGSEPADRFTRARGH